MHDIAFPPFPVFLAWLTCACAAAPVSSHNASTPTAKASIIPLVKPEAPPPLSLDCTNPGVAAPRWSFNAQRYVEVSCELAIVAPEDYQSLTYIVSPTGKGGSGPPLCTPGSTSIQGNVSALGPIAPKQRVAIACLFPSTARRRMSWEVTASASPTSASAKTPRIRASFELNRGRCQTQCKSDAFCEVGSFCDSGCCIPPWGQCGTFPDPESCGRCCAITAGSKASDCVISECVN